VILNGTTIDSLYTSSSSITIADGKAVQFIYNNGASVTNDSGIGGLTRYDIHVAEGGALDTTATAGVYTVTMPEGMKYAIATDAEGNAYISDGNTLTVGSAGEYSVTFLTKLPSDKATYYLMGGATDGDGSAEAPFGTLKEIINAVNDEGLDVAGKVVTIRVIAPAENAGFGEENALYINPKRNYSLSYNEYHAAKEGYISEVITHKATFVFEKAENSERPILWMSGSQVDRYTPLRLGGPTVFTNVDLGINRSQYGRCIRDDCCTVCLHGAVYIPGGSFSRL
jgi:hypothetical protein